MSIVIDRSCYNLPSMGAVTAAAATDRRRLPGEKAAASLARAAREAQRAGEVQAEIDPEQLAWELDCLLSGANNGFVRGGGNPVLERARRAIRDRLERAATASAARLATR